MSVTDLPRVAGAPELQRDGAGGKLPPLPAVPRPLGWAEDGLKGHGARGGWERSGLASLTCRTPDWELGEPCFTPRSCFSTSLTVPVDISSPVPPLQAFQDEKLQGWDESL